jgi:hypothetical protein
VDNGTERDSSAEYQRPRPLHDRHRPVKFAHCGTDARAQLFAADLAADGQLARTATVRAEPFGSLDVTGHGHGSPKAVILDLLGQTPEDVDPDRADELEAEVKSTGRPPA